MAEPWMTIAPIRNSSYLPDGLKLPHYFSANISYRLIPPWVNAQNAAGEHLRSKVREHMTEAPTHCFAVEYDADALGSPDLNWQGQKRGMQDAAVEAVSFLTTAFWLIRPVTVQFQFIMHAVQHHGAEWLIRSANEGPPHVFLEDYGRERYTIQDCHKAGDIFQILWSPSIVGSVHTAAQTTSRALSEGGWILRFLLLWLAMECLFGPEDPREITFQLSQRAALFIEKDPTTARKLFGQLKASYAWRSKIVHGLRLSKLTQDKSFELLVELEAIVRRSLTAVLENTSIASKFDGPEREEFLNALAFK